MTGLSAEKPAAEASRAADAGSIVAVAMALPHVAGAKLRLLLKASYAALVLVTIHGFRPDPSTALPSVVQFIAIVGATAAAGYLLVLLLWQFTRVARETLDVTRAASESAEVARQRSA